ncbi:MAG: T9SS type A sorting domain-containing protein [Sphingobacteriales bacterium]|nr:MAG: T9SS type A sorting domain-containing protein [Sphingobacteriales bacterium]
MRLLVLSILMLVICSSPGKAQTAFPNGDFESWDTLDYEDLHSSYWITGNRIFTMETGVSPMSKVAGHQSAQAIRLEVKKAGRDTLFPFFANEDVESFFEDAGGKPYSEGLPTAFQGFCRYNLLNTDTAHIYLVFKKDGAVLSRDTMRFYGNNPFFTDFTLPLNMSDKPDTIIAFAVIGDAIEGIPATPGSWLELDSLTFTISGVPQLLPDANFERWVKHDYDTPEDWDVWSDTYPGLVVRSTDKKSGMYALQLSTIVDSFFMDTLMGQVAIQHPVGPVAVGSLDSLKFHYKYSGANGDMASMVIQYYGANGAMLGTPHIIFLNNASNYVQIAHDLTGRPNGTASVGIMMQSSSLMSDHMPGSVLHIDDIRVDKFLSVNDKAIVKYSVYPNPAHDVLNITAKEVLDYNIKDMTGRTLMTGNTESGKISINAIPTGNYMLTLTDRNGNSQSMKFSKQ